MNLTQSDRDQIAEILGRRANEIAMYSSSHNKNDEMPGSVELALSREIARLRRLRDALIPTEPKTED